MKEMLEEVVDEEKEEEKGVDQTGIGKEGGEREKKER